MVDVTHSYVWHDSFLIKMFWEKWPKISYIRMREIYQINCVAMRCSVLQCVAVCCSVDFVYTDARGLPICVSVVMRVCCSVLHCVAVCCSVLQCVVVCCSVSGDSCVWHESKSHEPEKTCDITNQRRLVIFVTNLCYVSNLQVHTDARSLPCRWGCVCVTATYYNTQQHSATHCNTQQHTATRINSRQRTATHCNTY